eukprot:UN27921
MNRYMFLDEVNNEVSVEDVCESLGLCSSACLHKYKEEQALDAELIKNINSDKKSSWVAGVNERFINATLADVIKELGTFMLTDFESPFPEKTFTPRELSDTPKEFDWRTES